MSAPATFVPDRFKMNSYRVLRISANATLSEIRSAAATMRRAAMLGVTSTSDTDGPLLGEVRRAESDIRTAEGRLENPQHRLSDRLFWFNLGFQAQTNETQNDSKISATGPNKIPWKHDDALRTLFAALGRDLDDAGIQAWLHALRAWHQVVSDDEYWGLSLELEERGCFEPAALPSEMDTLREGAVSLAAEPLLGAARDAVVRNDTSIVARVLIALGGLANTGSWTIAAQEDISSPIVARFRDQCRSVRDESGSKIVREQNTAKTNKILCDAALKRFRGEIGPALADLLKIFAPDQEAVQRVREESALCLSGIATDYTWADEYILSEKLNEEALKLAHDTLGAVRIEHGLEQVRASASRQRVFGTSVSSAPSLRTINGFGFTMYGQSDYDAESKSYSATHYFVALFLPIFPLGRYRVINAGGRHYRFLGKIPLRMGDRWHLGISITAVAAFILMCAISPSHNTTATYHPPSSPSYYSPPPNPNQSRLSDIKARIDSGRMQLAVLNNQLQPVATELTSIDSQMATLGADLKALDDQNKSGIQIDADGYNAKVAQYNALLAKRQALVATNSADIQNHDNLVKQDAALVEEYNTLLK